MILPFNVSATFVAGTPQQFPLTLDAANPDYDDTPSVPTNVALLSGTLVSTDSDGILVEFGLGDAADGGSFAPLIPVLVGNDCQYPEGRVRGEFTASRVPTLRIRSKTNQIARVMGHVELVPVS